MLEIKNVSVKYAGAEAESLCQFSLSVKGGECVLLTGASGCGKTTVTLLPSRCVMPASLAAPRTLDAISFCGSPRFSQGNAISESTSSVKNCDRGS